MLSVVEMLWHGAADSHFPTTVYREVGKLLPPRGLHSVPVLGVSGSSSSSKHFCLHLLPCPCPCILESALQHGPQPCGPAWRLGGHQ